MLTLFFPRKILEIDSKINKKIRVYKWLGDYLVKTGEITQSGGFVKDIWEKGVKETQKILKRKNINQGFTILILGLGCGTLAKILSKKFPQAEIYGVEIDKSFIDIGKKFFSLAEISNLKIIIGDAEEIVKKIARGKKKFFLIFLDCYVGDNFPKKLEKESFLTLLRRILKREGVLIINRLYYKEKIKETDLFIKKLKIVFPFFQKLKYWSNLLLFCFKNNLEK